MRSATNVSPSALVNIVSEAIKGRSLHQSEIYPPEVDLLASRAEDALRAVGVQRGEGWVNKSSGAKNYLVTVEIYESERRKSVEAKLLPKLKKLGPVKIVRPYNDDRAMYVFTIPKSEDALVTPKQFVMPEIPGIADVSTEKQRANGTLVIKDKETDDKYALYSNGYVRKIVVSTSPYTAGREDGQVIMKPGGGSPEEMMDLVVSKIKKSRMKRFGEGRERRLAEIKGKPLHMTAQYPPDVRRAFDEIQREVRDNMNVSRSNAFINLSANAKNYVVSVEFRNSHALSVQEIRDFAGDCKRYGNVKLTPQRNYGMSESNDWRVTVSIPKAEDAIQQNLSFNVPQINGVEDISTEKQRANGTVALLDKETDIKYFLQSSGYVRKRRPGATLDSNLMLPGGGTPEEMVQKVVNAITKDRKAVFGEGVTNQDVRLALREIRSRMRDQLAEASAGTTVVAQREAAQEKNIAKIEKLLTSAGFGFEREPPEDGAESYGPNGFYVWMSFSGRGNKPDRIELHTESEDDRHVKDAYQYANMIASHKKIASKIEQLLKAAKFDASVKGGAESSFVQVLLPVASAAAQPEHISASDFSDIGLVDVSTSKQSANGTLVMIDKQTGAKYSVTSSGYVRKHLPDAEDAQILMKPGSDGQAMINAIKAAVKRSRVNPRPRTGRHAKALGY